MAKVKPHKFNVGFFIKQWVEIEVDALTLEDAIKTGRTLGIDDVMDRGPNVNDSSIKVLQAYDPDFEI